MKRLFVPLKSSVDHSLALGERVAAGRVRVNPRELLPKMSKLEVPLRGMGNSPEIGENFAGMA
jgi:hypothetical protein